MHADRTPMDPRDAFTVTVRPDSETSEEAAEVQAAVLLTTRSGVLGARPREMEECERLAADDGFELPPLRPLRRDHRLRVAQVERVIDVSRADLDAESSADRVQERIAELARDVYEHPSAEAAAGLFEAAMRSRHPLVRVAAAAGARETTRSRPIIREILVEGATSDDPMIAELATTALAQIRPHHDAVRRRVATPPPTTPKNRESNTAVLTHGTFAADGAWYRIGGDFYDRLAANRPDLDVYDPSFTWTGGYSHTARDGGAALLSTWIPNEGLMTPDFFSHSHGGTVAHLATRRGVQFDRLVHMAVPVHAKWFPDPAGFDRLVDVRVRSDLVILLDRGGQRFRNTPFQAKIDEHRHGWFNHSAPHDPDYWDTHGLWAEI